MSQPREVYISYALDNLLKDYKERCTPENFEAIQKEVAVKFAATQKKLMRIKDAVERAKAAHKIVQEKIDSSRDAEFDKAISCKSGCAGCCHQQVEVSGDEGKLLARLVENGVKIDFSKLRRLSQKTFTDTDIEWWRLPKSENACLFLGEDNRCRIYRHRPMACRKYFVWTEPERCSAVSEEGSIEVGVQTITDAEIAASAAVDLVRGEGNIPHQLAQHLGPGYVMRARIEESKRSEQPAIAIDLPPEEIGGPVPANVIMGSVGTEGYPEGCQ